MDTLDGIQLILSILVVIQAWQLWVINDLKERIKRLEDKFIND